jgi:hypothetical protein
MINKKFYPFALILFLFLAACSMQEAGDTPTPAADPSNSDHALVSPIVESVSSPPASDTPVISPTQPPDDIFIFEYRGHAVLLGEDMEEVIQKIGEARRIYEMPSCALEGIDRIFSYPGVDIYTYPDKDRDFVYLIYFKDDSVGTKEEIYLGSSLHEVTAAYGTEYLAEGTQYTYTRGDAHLVFLFLDTDRVEAITYRLDVF